MKGGKVGFKNDEFKRSRGGYSRLLEIICAKCGETLFFYQKDGPGILKRLYLDRIFDSGGGDGKGLSGTRQLNCTNCKEHLGTMINYEKENRLAYRLFAGAVTKRIVKSKRG